MRTAAIELAPRGIRVNAVCPGPVDTAFVKKAGVPESAMPDFNTAMQRRIPLGRIGTPGDIAKLAAFVSSDDASYITGAEYLIDGGINVNQILG
ncbi:MAG: short-chain dehydrogenase [Fibrobacteres bacterium]|nr:short-chain dehydrogenase [Fibrobacterota bacterium]